MTLEVYQQRFIEFAIRHDILCFGEFTLKSGRKSPYFFNAGLFNTGKSLGFLGSSYAAAIRDRAPDFDLMFGPAYKGIPLVSVTSAALALEFGVDKPYAFNRKEAKGHGEGGQVVGAPLQGDVLIIDDVITAGTAIREVMDLLAQHGARAAGILVALDRQEKGRGELSAIQEIERDYGIPVISLVNLQQIIDYLQAENSPMLNDHLDAIRAYRDEYGVSA